MSASLTPESELLAFGVSIGGVFTDSSASQALRPGTGGGWGCGAHAGRTVARPWPALPWLACGQPHELLVPGLRRWLVGLTGRRGWERVEGVNAVWVVAICPPFITKC